MIFNNADNIMYGDKEVDRVFYGKNLVWERYFYFWINDKANKNNIIDTRKELFEKKSEEILFPKLPYYWQTVSSSGVGLHICLYLNACSNSLYESTLNVKYPIKYQSCINVPSDGYYGGTGASQVKNYEINSQCNETNIFGIYYNNESLTNLSEFYNIDSAIMFGIYLNCQVESPTHHVWQIGDYTIPYFTSIVTKIGNYAFASLNIYNFCAWSLGFDGTKTHIQNLCMIQDVCIEDMIPYEIFDFIDSKGNKYIGRIDYSLYYIGAYSFYNFTTTYTGTIFMTVPYHYHSYIENSDEIYDSCFPVAGCSEITIGDYAFYNSNYPSYVYVINKKKEAPYYGLGHRLPTDINIGEYAFYNCSNLRQVYLINQPCDDNFISEITIHSNAFSYCENLNKISFESETGINEKIDTFCYVIEIYPYAINNCSNLRNIRLINKYSDWHGNGIILHENAFCDCNSLKNVYIDSPKLIKKNAFKNCNNIEKIVLIGRTNSYDENNPKFEQDAFAEQVKNKVVFYVDNNIEKRYLLDSGVPEKLITIDSSLA